MTHPLQMCFKSRIHTRCPIPLQANLESQRPKVTSCIPVQETEKPWRIRLDRSPGIPRDFSRVGSSMELGVFFEGTTVPPKWLVSFFGEFWGISWTGHGHGGKLGLFLGGASQLISNRYLLYIYIHTLIYIYSVCIYIYILICIYKYMYVYIYIVLNLQYYIIYGDYTVISKPTMGVIPWITVVSTSPGGRIFCPTFILAAWEAHFGPQPNAGTTGLWYPLVN